MGHISDVVSPSLVEDYGEASIHVHTSGPLTFEYHESGPGHQPAEFYDRHCMIIPVQNEAIRIISSHDGTIERFTLHRDDIALAHAGSETSWQWLDPAKVILISIDPTAFQKFVEIEMRLLLNGSRLENQIVITDPDLRSAAERMRQSLLLQDIGSDIIFDALARVFLVLLVRRYGRQSASRIDFGAEFGARQYSKVVEYIETNLDQKITPGKLASLVGMSEAVFARKFKMQVGKAPMKFVADVKIQTATRLLADKTLTLSKIAARCGYADQAHFSRSFKKSTGVSPSKYRNTGQDA